MADVIRVVSLFTLWLRDTDLIIRDTVQVLIISFSHHLRSYRQIINDTHV